MGERTNGTPKMVWTQQAEMRFKRYLRTWPFLPRDVARACCELCAELNESHIVRRSDVIDGLNRYNRFGQQGIQPFEYEGIRIETQPPYTIVRGVKIPEPEIDPERVYEFKKGEWKP
jgi:hypothetical protein